MNKQTLSVSDNAACLLIKAGAKNILCDGTAMGPHAHQLMYQNLRGDFGKDVCAPAWFNPGFPFRIWRDSGIGYALGRNRPEHALDGQARTPAEAVEMAGNEGIIVMANVKVDSSEISEADEGLSLTSCSHFF